MKIRIAGFVCFLMAIASPAFAGEACTDAKDMIRLVKAFYAADADRIDIINPKAVMRFEGLNGHPVPDQMLYRHEGDEIYLNINEDGFLDGMEALVSVSKDGEICRVIDGKVPAKTDEETTSVNMNFEFPYRRADGQFTIEEIMEGAKDGSKVMDGVAPGGLGFAVPGLKAIVLKPAQEDGATPDFSFTRKGEVVSVPVSKFGESRFIRLKDIKSSKADALTIEGEYSLEAMFKFDPEKMAEGEAKRIAEVPAE